ncbi:MAG TPA: hypothetical protein DEA08_09545 [Planctomycetes bacterium]|nr:hypothetical protein [Planctomycetota bacterium]
MRSSDLPPDEVLEALFEDLGSAALGSAEVRALAARHGVAREVVEDCLAGLQALSVQPGPGGRRFGPYVLERLIAEGGMGAVYLARDTVLDRRVALKVLRSGSLAGARQLARFQREACALAELRHPNVVGIHAAGKAAQGAYLVLELVEGARSIVEAAEGLDWRSRLELVRDAARGLGYAHRRGVLHRDVKPDNLLVDRQGLVRVSDFGLTLQQGEQERLTRTGAVLGTVGYMAPEQVEGDLARQGPPTDVWGLGVVLYEVLTGTELFPGVSIMERFAAQARWELPSLGQRHGLPRSLDAVLATALQRDPGARYPDAVDFANDLDAVLAGLPPAALGARRPCARGALILSLALILASALTVGLALRSRWPNDTSASSSPTPRAPRVPLLAATPSAAAARPWQRDGRELGGQLELLAARRWLRRHPRHPAAARAQRLFASSPSAPLLQFVHHPQGGRVRLTFDRDQAVVSCGDGRLRRWSLPGGTLSARLRVRGLERALPLPGGAWLLAGKAGLERWPGEALWGEGGSGRGAAGKLGRGDRLGRGARWVARLGDVGALALEPQGRRVAVIVDTRVVVLALDSGRVLRRLAAGPGEAPHRLTFLDERTLLVASKLREGSVLAVWKLEHGERVARARFPPTSALLSFGPDTFLLGTYRGQVLLLQGEGLEVQRRLHGRTPELQWAERVFADGGSVGALARLPGTQALLALPGQDVAVADRTIKRFDLAAPAGLPTHVTPQLPASPCSLAVDSAGDLLGLGQQDGTLSVWVLPP